MYCLYIECISADYIAAHLELSKIGLAIVQPATTHGIQLVGMGGSECGLHVGSFLLTAGFTSLYGLDINAYLIFVYLKIRQQMEVQVAQKSSELEQYLKRVKELEEMYHRLQEALDDEKQARLEEESARLLQAR